MYRLSPPFFFGRGFFPRTFLNFRRFRYSAPRMGTNHSFEGHDLACVRAGRIVFARRAFRVEAGGLLILRGPNGAGKSSLLRLMAGLIPPAHGALLWNGEDVADDPDAHRARLAYAGHDDALKPGMSVAEHLEFHAATRGAAKARIGEALAAFGLEALAKTHARFLSAGQRKRVALARAIAAPASLWLLDEPGNGLDAPSLARLEAAIANHRKQGGIVVAATHLDLAGADAATLTLDGAKAA
jgi:heme exporter protein A